MRQMKIILVEDDKDLREIITKSLTRERYVVETAATSAEACMKVSAYEYDCMLLDIMLPDGSGLDVLRQVHSLGCKMGVIIISAKDSIDDKVEGLDLGADDYLPKPFHLAELHARVKSVIRRHSGGASEMFTVGNVSMDQNNFVATVCGEALDISRKEYDILLYLIMRKGRLVSKQTLAEGVWGDHFDMADNFDFIYAQMKNLRKKLKSAGATIEIKTVYGFGYKLEEV